MMLRSNQSEEREDAWEVRSSQSQNRRGGWMEVEVWWTERFRASSERVGEKKPRAATYLPIAADRHARAD